MRQMGHGVSVTCRGEKRSRIPLAPALLSIWLCHQMTAHPGAVVSKYHHPRTHIGKQTHSFTDNSVAKQMVGVEMLTSASPSKY